MATKRRKRVRATVTKPPAEPGITITIGPIPLSALARAGGALYDHSDECAAVLAQIKAQVDSAVASTPPRRSRGKPPS